MLLVKPTNQTSLLSLVVPVLPAVGTGRLTVPLAVPRSTTPVQHRGQLVGRHRVHHALAVGNHLGRQAGIEARKLAVVAEPLVVAVDGLAVAVLHPVDQRRLAPARRHWRTSHRPQPSDRALSPRSRARWQGTGPYCRRRRSVRHSRPPRPCRLPAPDGWSSGSASCSMPGAQRRRPVEFVGGIARAPEALRRVDLDRARPRRWWRGCSRCRVLRHRRRA